MTDPAFNYFDSSDPMSCESLVRAGPTDACLADGIHVKRSLMPYGGSDASEPSELYNAAIFLGGIVRFRARPHLSVTSIAT